MKIERQYLGGITFDKSAIRKYECTILDDKELEGKVYFQELFTKKKKGIWGKGETTFYETMKSKEFKSFKWFIKSLRRKHKVR